MNELLIQFLERVTKSIVHSNDALVKLIELSVIQRDEIKEIREILKSLESKNKNA